MFEIDSPNLTAKERYYRYALGHLSSAVTDLCVAPGKVNERLILAFESINKIDIDALPAEIRSSLQRAVKEATKFKTDGKTDLQTSLRRRRSSTGSKIAAQILKAKIELEEYIS